MSDPTSAPDWYPSALRPKDAQPYSPWDKYEATTHISALPPVPRDRNEALRTMNQIGSLVYACRVPGDLIKIGYSEHLSERRNSLRGELLAVMFGTFDDEQAIHAQLAGHLHHGREWYYPTPGVLAVVNAMRSRLGLDPLAA